MSTYQGIAATTQKIVDVLKRRGVTVTARPPDKAREGISATQLNVFLYHAAINAAWRNQDLPRPNLAGQPARPLLPLNLYYLITAYGNDSAGVEIPDIVAHDALGRAILTLHDAPELRDIGSSIRNQPGPIRATLQPLSLDEMTKLWSSFQTGYRPSVAYEISAVLMESELAEPTPLPVQRRGNEDRGWDSTSQFPPAITGIRFRTNHQPGTRLAEPFILTGQNLKQAGVAKVKFDHRRLKSPLFLDPDSLSDGEIAVTIPNSDAWPAGVCTITVQNTIGAADHEHTYTSNSVRLDLLPEIVVPAGGLKAILSGENYSLNLACRPKLHPQQTVQLLIGSVSFDVPVSSITGAFTVTWKARGVNFPKGDRSFARLRVDGVDSLIHDPQRPEQGFDPKYEVKFP